MRHLLLAVSIIFSVILPALLPGAGNCQNFPPGVDPAADAAAEKEVRVFIVGSTEKIVRAYALLLFEPELRALPPAGLSRGELSQVIPQVQRRTVGFRQIDARSWEILVPIEEKDRRARAKITVVAVTETGKSVTSPMQWVLEGNLVRNVGELAEVRCAEIEAPKELELLAGYDLERLEQLAAVRRQRLSLLASLAKERITPEVSAKIAELESGFGISRGERITKKTPLPDLAQRLMAVRVLMQPREILEAE